MRRENALRRSPDRVNSISERDQQANQKRKPHAAKNISSINKKFAYCREAPKAHKVFFFLNHNLAKDVVAVATGRGQHARRGVHIAVLASSHRNFLLGLHLGDGSGALADGNWCWRTGVEDAGAGIALCCGRVAAASTGRGDWCSRAGRILVGEEDAAATTRWLYRKGGRKKEKGGKRKKVGEREVSV